MINTRGKIMGKKILTAGILSLSLAISSVFAEDKVIATVNGEDITQSSFDMLTELMKKSKRFGDIDKSTIVDDLVITEIVRQEAKKSTISERDDIKKKVKEFEERLVLSAWSQDKIKGLNITDEDLKTAYDKRMKGQDKNEYKARHILVKTEAEAKVLIDELKKGTDFIELAKTKSTGPSGPKGGDLGWFSPNAMVAPFSQAVQKMEKGKLREAPVKTEFGFHIIKLDDKRDLKLPGLDAVKPQIKRVIEQEKMKEYIQSLRAAADVKILINLADEKKSVEAKPATDTQTAAPDKTENKPADTAEQKK